MADLDFSGLHPVAAPTPTLDFSSLTPAASNPRTQAPGYGPVFSAAQGATGNFGDEAAAALRAGTVGLASGIKRAAGDDGASFEQRLSDVADRVLTTYDLRRDDLRQGQKDYQQDHPVQAALAEAGGGLATGIAAGGGLARAVGSAPTFLGRFAGSTGIGGAVGAVGGFGAGEGGIGDRAEKGLEAAGLGAITGGVVGASGEGLGIVAPGLVSRIKALFGGSIADRDISKIAQAFDRDGVTVDDVAHRLEGAQMVAPGKPIGIADVMGPNTATGQLLRTARDVSPEAASYTDQALSQRDLGTGVRGGHDLFVQPGTGAANRITSDLNDVLSGGDAFQSKDAILAERDQTAKPFYRIMQDEAPAMPADQLADQFAKPTFRKALATAQAEHADLGLPSLTDYVDFNEAGDPVAIKNGLPFSVVDRVKQVMDGMVEDARQPNGKLSYAGNAIRTARDSLRDAADDFWDGSQSGLPSYSDVRAAFSGPTQSARAIDMGTQFLNNRPEENAAILAKLAPEDQDLFKLGVKQALIDRVDNSPNGANEIRRLLGTPLLQKQFEAVFSPDELDNLANRLGYENRMFATKAAQGGSQSTPRAAAIADFGSDTDLTGAARALVQAKTNPLGLIGAVAGKYGARVVSGLNEETATGIAKALGPDTGQLPDILDRIRQLPAGQKAQAMESLLAQRRVVGAMAGAGVGAGISSGQ